MKQLKIIVILTLGLWMLTGCTQKVVDYSQAAQNPEWYHQTVKNLTDVIVYDIFSPPVASRIYAYPNIAAYEVIRQENSEYLTLAGQLTDLGPVPAPPADTKICFPLASLQALMKCGKQLVFSEDKMVAYEEKVYAHFREIGVPQRDFDASIAYGNVVAEHIMSWADKDNYKQTRTFPQYTVNRVAGRWTPTPPDYMAGIEPHWNKIRPFIIDSATQFIPVPPTPYDMDKGSQFYNEMMEVYETGNNLNDEQREIAEFWDCNPFVTHHQGHVMFATKKITPGGHWIGITNIACRIAEADIMQTAEAYARTSIALADAFISCWDEKYRSELIRPETVINDFVDEDWQPLLQTPPFPEYTSGHSVISTAAAITLTDLFGSSFQFIDSTELEYGLPPRSFDSFLDASAEAAVSRLYGGIHYMPAIDNGVDQGKKVGNFVVANLVTRKEETTVEN